MTSPQNELYRLANRIERLTDLFERDGENAETIFDAIKEIRVDLLEHLSRHSNLENQMALIIKLLTKE
jgi:hypothetical protein